MELFEAPGDFGGVLTSGATMANFTGLAAARRGSPSRTGSTSTSKASPGCRPRPFYSGYVHPSAAQAVGMLGIGRARVRRLPPTHGRRLYLATGRGAGGAGGRAGDRLANAGEVNAGECDPIEEMVASPRTTARGCTSTERSASSRRSIAPGSWTAGVELADSVTADRQSGSTSHDCGFAFVRDPQRLQGASTSAAPTYRSPAMRPSFADFRRPLAGPVPWRSGRPSRLTVARATARWSTATSGRPALASQVDAAPDFELLAPVQLNVVCFRYRPRDVAEADLDELNRRLGAAVLADGRVFFGTTVYGGIVAFRPAISNWRTTETDVDLIVPVARELGESLAVSR